MLTCIYHPLDPMRVVEAEEADTMKASGVWFDCPAKAKAYRNKVESEIKQEAQETVSPKPKSRGKFR